MTDLFPFYLRGRKIKISGVHLFAFANDSMVSIPFFDVFLTPDGLAPNPTDDQFELNSHPTFDKTLHGHVSWCAGKEKKLGEWTIKILSGDFVPLEKKLDDIVIIYEYQLG